MRELDVEGLVDTMRTNIFKLTIMSLCVSLIVGCTTERKAEVSDRAEQRDTTSRIAVTDQQNASLTAPLVIRGVSMETAMEEVSSLLGSVCSGAASEEPIDIDPFMGAEAVRTTLDRYLEERLLEALSRRDFVVVPRTDDVVQFNRRISQSREGQVDLSDRLDFGRQRSAKLLIKARTTRLSTHLELFLMVYRIETSEMAASRRVELAWEPALRELDQVRLILPEESHDAALFAAAVQSGNRVAVEGEPLSVECRLEAFVPSGVGHRVVPRREPLHDGGTLRTDDAFAIHFQTNRDCYVYAFLHSSDGSAVTIFPHDEIQLSNRVTGNRWHRIPDANAAGQVKQYVLDDVTGIETIYLVASEEPLSDLAAIARRLGPASEGGDSGDVSRRLVAKMKEPDKRKWLQLEYVDRPGVKGIRPHLAPSDTGSPAVHGDSAATHDGYGLESLGLVTRVLTIRHVGK